MLLGSFTFHLQTNARGAALRWGLIIQPFLKFGSGFFKTVL